MAEYCIDCLNALIGTNEPAKKFIITKECELCEGCGQLKPVVVRYKKPLPIEILKKVVHIIKLLFYPIVLLYKLVKRMYVKRVIKARTNRR